MAANDETPASGGKFDFSVFPPDTLFHDRRDPELRRVDGSGTSPAPPPLPTPSPDRRVRKERRRRIDPTTFEKQYSDDELEFMNAMQRYKVQSGKAFPSHGEVLRVARSLGYRRPTTPDPRPDRAGD